MKNIMLRFVKKLQGSHRSKEEYPPRVETETTCKYPPADKEVNNKLLRLVGEEDFDVYIARHN